MDEALEHPSELELRAFARRALDPASVMAVDRHLSACQACSLRLEQIGLADFLYRGMRGTLDRDAANGHLSYEEVRAAAEGHPSPEAAGHLQRCANCRAEVDDLADFVAALAPKAQPASSRTYWRWVAAAAALIVLVPVAWRFSLPRVPPRSIPTEYATTIATTLRTRRLAVPERFRQSSGDREVQLGVPPATPAFAVLHPYGEATLTGKPRFSWEPLAGTAGYRVRIYDHGFHKVSESPELTATEWIPGEELAAGQPYTWVVTAAVNGKPVRAPVPPAPEARFSVLAAPDAARLQQVRRDYPDEHLLLAALFAQAGVIAEARQELDAMGRTNADPALVRDLEVSLPGEAQRLSPVSTKPAQ